MPTLQPIGRRRGILAPLLLITSFWIGGCQSPAIRSEATAGSDTRWKITGQAGRVSLRSPGQSFWQRAIPGARIVPDSQIATFDGSRLEVASAGDEVTASGPSRFTLPDSGQDGVRVRQNAGSLRYQVRSAPKRRFEVKTPHFSTVVKGTSFLVSIDRASSAVVVDEGRVLILDPDGEPLGELTAGQTGRMAAYPGAAFEVSTAAGPTFESAEPGAGLEASAHGNTGFPPTPNETGASLAAPTNGPGMTDAELSLFERIEIVVDDLAAELGGGGAPTSETVDLDNDRGGGAREEERRSSAGNRFDGSHGHGHGHRRGGKGKGKGKGGKAQGKAMGKGMGNAKSESSGKGNGRHKGHGYGRGKGVGGGGAHMILDRDARGRLMASSERH